jgi:hypothetical protein
VTGGVAVGSHFCWTEHDSATFAGVVGCTDVTGASTLSSMAIALPGNPATDGTRIYFTLGSGEVLAASVPLTGTYSNLTGAPKNTQQGRGAVSIAIFDGTAYLAYSTYPLTETGIATCSTNGCFHDGETVLVRDTMPLSAIAVDATGIYWAASGRGVMKMVF